MRKPLNGEKTHPLKPASIDVLRQLKRESIRAHRINPGIRDRLYREGLARWFYDGRDTFWTITEAGISALATIDAPTTTEGGEDA